MKKQLCAVQMHWQAADYRDTKAFEAKIRSIMEDVRLSSDPNALSLVAFPEDVGAPLILLDDYEGVKGASTLEQAVQKLTRRHLPQIVAIRIKYRVGWFRALFLLKAAKMAKVYMDVFSKMAKEYKVYLAAGSVLLPDFEWHPEISRMDYRLRGGKVYNTSFLFGPDGAYIGHQKKTFLVPGLEDAGGFDLCAGEIKDLRVFKTPLGSIGIAVCLDCFKTPVTQALNKLGANILIQPSANSKPWTQQEQQDWLAGCWQAMNAGHGFQFAINPMMTGCLFDLCFEGQSSILAHLPKEEPSLGYKDLNPETGFVKVADSSLKEEILIFSWDE